MTKNSDQATTTRPAAPFTTNSSTKHSSTSLPSSRSTVAGRYNTANPALDFCPVARTTALVGDRWSMLILRNATFGVKRFDEFQEGLGISRATLTDRLRVLVQDGFFTRLPYQEKPIRYEYVLTDKGRAFFAVIAAMWQFGIEWLFGEGREPFLELRTKAGTPVTPIVVDRATGEPIDCRGVRVRRRSLRDGGPTAEQRSDAH